MAKCNVYVGELYSLFYVKRNVVTIHLWNINNTTDYLEMYRLR